MPGDTNRLQAICPEAENYSEAGLSAIRKIADLDDRSMGPEELQETIGKHDLLFVRFRTPVTRELMAAGTRLRAIITPTTGVDHIDLESASFLGIKVFHLRGETEFLRTIPSTAEHSWALLLALSRRIPAATRSVLAGQWRQKPYRGHELHAKRLGVLGFGRLGSMVARYGQAFGMDVRVFDPYVDVLPPYVQRCDSLPALLTACDVLTIHVPLNETTTGLIGSSEIDMLPRGAMLINTSRGEIVDEEALIHALRDHQIAGAAIDVIQKERAAEVRTSPLIAYAREHDNLIVTPHIGGATVEAVEKTDLFLIGKLADWLDEGMSRDSSSLSGGSGRVT